MSDPINHEPRTEISMGNQQELAADQVLILFETFYLKIIIFIYLLILDNDNVRFD